MTPWSQNQTPAGFNTAGDVDALKQQIDRLAEINRRLTWESILLRQQLDALIDQSAEQTIAQLKQTVDSLKQTNADLTHQLARQQHEHAQTAARLAEEIRSLQALVAHQHTRLKEAFGAGLFGAPPAED